MKILTFLYLMGKFLRIRKVKLESFPYEFLSFLILLNLLSILLVLEFFNINILRQAGVVKIIIISFSFLLMVNLLLKYIFKVKFLKEYSSKFVFSLESKIFYLFYIIITLLSPIIVFVMLAKNGI